MEETEFRGNGRQPTRRENSFCTSRGFREGARPVCRLRGKRLLLSGSVTHVGSFPEFSASWRKVVVHFLLIFKSLLYLERWLLLSCYVYSCLSVSGHISVSLATRSAGPSVPPGAPHVSTGWAGRQDGALHLSPSGLSSAGGCHVVPRKGRALTLTRSHSVSAGFPDRIPLTLHTRLLQKRKLPSGGSVVLKSRHLLPSEN